MAKTATAPKQKTKKQLVMKSIIVILLIILVAAGVGVYALFTSSAHAAKGKSPFAGMFAKAPEQDKLFPLSTFTIELADQSYASISMNIGYTGSADAELKNNTSIIRDKIISEVMKLQQADFTAKNLDSTKTRIIKAIKPLVKSGSINHIYMDNLAVQQ
ncbi:flagellar basal body-associated FliL family protein (plasmid) [Aneurinibacillus sp. Ricciae_BoGa-3]|uniref:flagellar basal body-associated FliL family protein n=1 Tax=Aneurinibacillus sp. Ricciae_BoGa-3 TaxID=3022697 RepID=UPI0023418BAE|nr:flagellar basal body-associated FliL family protein [Aneurinibacillus sp. Ricciae_BoGa-3]WCK57517.1 flagellar basal body-associated FliL family protein [Aneurinibacillus sp. Ricciae_BoGa-3]